MPDLATNVLYYGDNLDIREVVLREPTATLTGWVRTAVAGVCFTLPLASCQASPLASPTIDQRARPSGS